MSGVEIAAFETEMEARVCVSYLLAHGVDAELAHAMTLSVMPFLSGKRGFRVTAPEAQARTARELLAAVDKDEADEEF